MTPDQKEAYNLVEWAEVGMNLFADLLQEVGDVEVELIDGEGPDAIRENYSRVIRAALAASQPAPFVKTPTNDQIAALQARVAELEAAVRRSQRALMSLPVTNLEIADCIETNRAALHQKEID